MQISPLFSSFSWPSVHSSLAPSFLLFKISFLRLDSSRQRSGNYGHVLLVRRLGEEAAAAATATRTTAILSSLVVESSVLLVLQVVVFLGLLLPPAALARLFVRETHRRSTLRNSSAT